MVSDLLKPPDEMRDLVARAAHYADTDVTDGTKRGYASSFRHFQAKVVRAIQHETEKTCSTR